MSTCRVISRANALALQGYRHACHVMLHTPIPEEVKLFGYYPIQHSALMQVRFDGRLGFPGGFVDDRESLEDAVNRELKEEMGKTTEPVLITHDNYVITHTYEQVIAELGITKRLCLHFFMKKVSLEQFLELEARSPNLTNLGFEVLGTVRCPIYTLTDKEGGLPAFLKHNFVGNAREQLVIGITKQNLLTSDELQEAIARSGVEVDFSVAKL
ncbi:hypothetical protein QZH41_017170 [Actinostola sp. cb2023]|nr:hypothetical protein QZH41_017170 [Actinostola sp. cb2023]